MSKKPNRNIQSLMDFQISNQRSHMIHDDLCARNFWDDDCFDDCGKLHIRRNGQKLVLFDGLCHLNRLQRKTRSKLNSMELPHNCELFLNDCCVDPEDWGKPITFNNPNIHVARSIGLHPNTLCTGNFFKETTQHLKTIAQKFQLASIGLIGATSTINDDTFNYKIQDIINVLKTNPNNHNTPIYIKSDSLDNDNHIHKAIKSSLIDSPIIWQSINRSDFKRFNNFTDQLLRQNNQYHLSIDGRLFDESVVSANRTYKIFSSYTELHERMILESGAPHGLPSYSRSFDGKLYPLHIADIIVELFYCLKQTPTYNQYTLSDVNDMIVSNGFNMFPRTVFYSMNTKAFRIITASTLGLTFKKYEKNINYDSPTLNNTTRTIRNAPTNNTTTPKPQKNASKPTPVQTTTPTYNHHNTHATALKKQPPGDLKNKQKTTNTAESKQTTATSTPKITLASTSKTSAVSPIRQPKQDSKLTRIKDKVKRLKTKKEHKCITNLLKARAALDRIVDDALDSTSDNSLFTTNGNGSSASDSSSIIITDSKPGKSDSYLDPDLISELLKAESD